MLDDNSQSRNAFTLIELLVVIAIISLLVSILLPSLTKAKQLAGEVACKSNLKSLSAAQYIYLSEYDGRFYTDGSDSVRAMRTLYPALLPYMGENHDVLICPSDERDPSLAWEPVVSLDQYRPDGQRHLCSYALNPYIHFHYPSYRNFFPGDIRIEDVAVPDSTVLHLCANANSEDMSGYNDYFTVGVAGWNASYRPYMYGHRWATNVAFCDGHVGTIRGTPLENLGKYSFAPYEGTWWLPKPYTDY